MELAFREELATSYKGATQKVRVLSEHWVSGELYCPNCRCANITRYPNNSPVADFVCLNCKEDYELKGHKRAIGATLVDGVYRTMIERLKASNNPNLLLLGYDHVRLEVRNLLVIPKHFFVPDMIEQRKPLSLTARRSGWVGCNIRLKGIPSAGRIFVVRNGVIEPMKSVLGQWRRTLFLRDQKDLRSKGWLLSVMRCIDKIQRSVFSLADLYAFEPELMSAYPENKHIRRGIPRNGRFERGVYGKAAAAHTGLPGRCLPARDLPPAEGNREGAPTSISGQPVPSAGEHDSD